MTPEISISGSLFIDYSLYINYNRINLCLNVNKKGPGYRAWSESDGI